MLSCNTLTINLMKVINLTEYVDWFSQDVGPNLNVQNNVKIEKSS